MCWWRGDSCRGEVEARGFPGSPRFEPSRLARRPPPRRRLAIGSASDISYRGGLGGHVVGRARRTQARAHFRQGHTWRARPASHGDRACALVALVATRPRRGLTRCVRLFWPSEEALYGGRVRGLAAAIQGPLTYPLPSTRFNSANVENSYPQRLQFVGERFKALAIGRAPPRQLESPLSQRANINIGGPSLGAAASAGVALSALSPQRASALMASGGGRQSPGPFGSTKSTSATWPPAPGGGLLFAHIIPARAGVFSTAPRAATRGRRPHL